MRVIHGLLALSIIGGEAVAQELPPIHVYVEPIILGTKACNVDQALIESAATALLKTTNVQVADYDAALDQKAIFLYITVDAEEFVDGSCYGHVEASLRSADDVYVPASKKRIRTTLDFCNRGGIFNASKGRIPSMLNTAIKDYAGQCLTAYKDLIKSP